MKTSIVPALVIVALAILLRLLHWMDLSQSLLANQLIGDEGTHLTWATAVLEEDFSQVTPYFRSPLYGHFLARILYYANGHLEAVRLLQFFLGCLSALLVYGIGTLCFSRRIAFLAGIGAALYPLSPFYESQLLITSLFTFLSLASLWSLARAQKNPSLRNWILLGTTLSLSLLTRANVLLWIGSLILYLQWHQQGEPLRLAMCWIGVSLCLALSTTWWANKHFGGDATPLATQGGINFWAGNHPQADGLIPVSPEIPADYKNYYKDLETLPPSIWAHDNMWQNSLLIARHTTHKPLTPSEASLFWYKVTFQQMFKNPSHTASLWLKKLIFLVGTLEIPNNSDPSYALKKFFPILHRLQTFFSFGILFALALPGAFIAWKRWPVSHPLHLYLTVMSISLILFFVTTRFRVPLVPPLLLFAATTIEALLSNQSYRSRILLVGAILLCFGFSQLCHLYAKSGPWKASQALYHNALAKVAIQRGDFPTAEIEIRKALTYPTKEQFLYYYTWAQLELSRSNDLQKVGKLLEKSILLEAHPTALKEIIKNYRTQGRIEDALAYEKLLMSLIDPHQETPENNAIQTAR